jgi:hypothetical protein
MESQSGTPEQFAALIAREIELTAKLLQVAGIKRNKPEAVLCSAVNYIGRAVSGIHQWLRLALRGLETLAWLNVVDGSARTKKKGFCGAPGLNDG